MEPVPEEAYYVDRFDDDLDDPTVHSKYPITFMQNINDQKKFDREVLAKQRIIDAEKKKRDDIKQKYMENIEKYRQSKLETKRLDLRELYNREMQEAEQKLFQDEKLTKDERKALVEFTELMYDEWLDKLKRQLIPTLYQIEHMDPED